MKLIGELPRFTHPELAAIACPNCSLRNDCRKCELYEFSLLAAIVEDDVANPALSGTEKGATK